MANSESRGSTTVFEPAVLAEGLRLLGQRRVLKPDPQRALHQTAGALRDGLIDPTLGRSHRRFDQLWGAWGHGHWDTQSMGAEAA